MIKLSRLADYSIVLMTQLAARPGSLVQAPDLALLTGLPVPTVAKTLKRLSHAGLVESQRGTKGGYVLVRDAADIPVTEIIVAVDGPIALTDCTVESDGVCEIEALCPTRTNWKKINEAVVGALRGISLADMTPQMAPFVPHRPYEPTRTAAVGE
ncbi:MAG: SUF system Fe-S cluster assembly regulator [Proteobacteria bacterium]|nr:SUF system Fe-S cluster assembly regulator [Pseudomonadota bacterium]